ncbi:MAG: mannose-1-phosphate guanylyltransferase [Verrucomicrobium sp.]|nr:mannose-1-phosphate guanylyltransferase [Verrucomicrobium sp.]
MDDARFFACVLAGGSGERFWPMSRQAVPKHHLTLFGEATLLEQSVRRALRVAGVERTFVLTSQAQAEATRRLLPFLPADQIVAEPSRRDTAPAAALATALARNRREDAVVALLPADALIRDGDTFAAQLRDAFTVAAEREACATFAIRPRYPATAFGYIEVGAPAAGAFHQIARFVEKPDAARASSYLETGRFGWNAGIFVWSAAWFLAQAEKSAPELAAFIRAGGPLDRFEQLPKISVDYAIMEKADRLLTAWAAFDWDDVGSWTALPDHLGQDEAGNTLRGPVVLGGGASNNIAVAAGGRVIALHGVSGLVVVETPDAILVCPKDKVQEIKELQALLPPGLR